MFNENNGDIMDGVVIVCVSVCLKKEPHIVIDLEF